MSLRLQTDFAIPGETVRVARAAFPKGNAYLAMRDELGTLFTDSDFADLYPEVGQPAAAPWRLALVTAAGSSPRTSLIAKPPTPSALGSTGSTPSAWSWKTPGSILACSPSSGSDCPWWGG